MDTEVECPEAGQVNSKRCQGRYASVDVVFAHDAYMYKNIYQVTTSVKASDVVIEQDVLGGSCTVG